jgi:hypothetical protein
MPRTRAGKNKRIKQYTRELKELKEKVSQLEKEKAPQLEKEKVAQMEKGLPVTQPGLLEETWKGWVSHLRLLF